MISTDCVVHKLMVKTAKDLCGHTLIHVEEEKGLGVIVDSQLNLRHTLMPRWPKLWLSWAWFAEISSTSTPTLCSTSTRPLYDHISSTLSRCGRPAVLPWTKIENVQKRAFNLVPELRGLTYQEQLVRTKLPTLAYRRFRGDLIEVYKHIKQYDQDAITSSFSTATRNRIRQTPHKSPLHARLFYYRVQ